MFMEFTSNKYPSAVTEVVDKSAVGAFEVMRGQLLKEVDNVAQFLSQVWPTAAVPPSPPPRTPPFVRVMCIVPVCLRLLWKSCIHRTKSPPLTLGVRGGGDGGGERGGGVGLEGGGRGQGGCWGGGG